MGIPTQKYTDWFLSQEDKTGDKALPIYQDFKNVLRMRSLDRGLASRWLFKGVLIHQHVLPALFRVFPDARVIYLRRDPCEAVASAASLETVLGAQFQHTNLKHHGPTRLPLLLQLEASTENYRKSLPAEIEKKRFITVLYKDMIKDPFSTIKNVYDHIGLEFTETFAEKMKNYLKENRQHKHGKHHYSLKQFGLSEEQVREAFLPVYGPSEKLKA